jgi:hypothetical protein
VGQQSSGEVALCLEKRAMESVEHLARWEPARRWSIESGVSAPNMKRKHRVNPGSCKLGHEAVEPVELRRIQRLTVGSEESGGRAARVEKMKSYCVQTESTKQRREPWCSFGIGKARVRREVRTEQLQSFTVTVEQVTTRRAHETILTRWKGVETRHIGNPSCKGETT